MGADTYYHVDEAGKNTSSTTHPAPSDLGDIDPGTLQVPVKILGPWLGFLPEWTLIFGGSQGR